MFIVRVYFLYEALRKGHVLRFQTKEDAEAYIKNRKWVFGDEIPALFDLEEVVA